MNQSQNRWRQAVQDTYEIFWSDGLWADYTWEQQNQEFQQALKNLEARFFPRPIQLTIDELWPSKEEVTPK